MVFTYKNKNYDIEIIRKNNKNTYIRIKNGKVYITTNYFTSSKNIKKLLTNNVKSISKMIDKYEQKEQEKKLFFLFGKKYDIVYDDNLKNINIINNKIYIKNSQKLNNYLKNYIKDVYSNHLKYWYNLFEEDIPIPNLKIRKMKTRWGVCNTKNYNITLNLELYRYDIECLDYVIVHELSHFLEPNHSKKFWQVVSKYYPNYKEIRKKLR
jgi:hypothetical protein